MDRQPKSCAELKLHHILQNRQLCPRLIHQFKIQINDYQFRGGAGLGDNASQRVDHQRVSDPQWSGSRDRLSDTFRIRLIHRNDEGCRVQCARLSQC